MVSITAPLATGTFVAWEGRSPLTGDPIALLVTSKSTNVKTGPMLQAWILLRDVAPFEALKSGQDAAICGGCVRRGLGEAPRTCYVSLFTGPSLIWRAYRAGKYPVLSLRESEARLAGQQLRVAAYGDPAVVPRALWAQLLPATAGWTGYTHLWALADRSLRRWFMASVDTPEEAVAAQAQGWRTFRAHRPDEPVAPGEVTCPASDEGGHRSTCVRCGLCRGTGRPAKSIAILEHGQHVAVRPGRRGFYGEIHAALDRGEAVTLDRDPREANRLQLAIRMRLLRRGDPRRLTVSGLRSGHVTWRLVEARP
jgi:hypothetical protein